VARNNENLERDAAYRCAAGAEFVLLFAYIVIVYWIIRNFGPAAQAGFGVGARVMQRSFCLWSH